MNEASLLFLLTGPYALARWAILSLYFRRKCVLTWEGGQNVPQIQLKSRPGIVL